MRIFTLICALMAWATSSQAQVVFDGTFRLSQIEGVKVMIIDTATGACWTNLKEVREYAEEKLRIKDAKILGQNDLIHASLKNYGLAVEVFARRLYTDDSGPCIGGVTLSLFTFAKVNEKMHVAQIAMHSRILTDHQNLNRLAINLTAELIGKIQR